MVISLGMEFRGFGMSQVSAAQRRNLSARRSQAPTEANYRRQSRPVQHLLGRSGWDADLLRDEVRVYVAQHLGQQDGVLIVDETGFVKKGSYSTGVTPGLGALQDGLSPPMLWMMVSLLDYIYLSLTRSHSIILQESKPEIGSTMRSRPGYFS